VKVAATWGQQQASLLEVTSRPGDTVGKLRLSPAGQQFFAIGLGELELGGQGISRFGDGVLAAISGHAHQWQHQRLEIRDGHLVASRS
jgi:hypothetical protein